MMKNIKTWRENRDKLLEIQNTHRLREKTLLEHASENGFKLVEKTEEYFKFTDSNDLEYFLYYLYFDDLNCYHLHEIVCAEKENNVAIKEAGSNRFKEITFNENVKTTVPDSFLTCKQLMLTLEREVWENLVGFNYHWGTTYNHLNYLFRFPNGFGLLIRNYGDHKDSFAIGLIDWTKNDSIYKNYFSWQKGEWLMNQLDTLGLYRWNRVNDSVDREPVMDIVQKYYQFDSIYKYSMKDEKERNEMIETNFYYYIEGVSRADTERIIEGICDIEDARQACCYDGI